MVNYIEDSLFFYPIRYFKFMEGLSAGKSCKACESPVARDKL
jgi:hypothetical protein